MFKKVALILMFIFKISYGAFDDMSLEPLMGNYNQRYYNDAPRQSFCQKLNFLFKKAVHKTQKWPLKIKLHFFSVLNKPITAHGIALILPCAINATSAYYGYQIASNKDDFTLLKQIILFYSLPMSISIAISNLREIFLDPSPQNWFSLLPLFISVEWQYTITTLGTLRWLKYYNWMPINLFLDFKSQNILNISIILTRLGATWFCLSPCSFKKALKCNLLAPIKINIVFPYKYTKEIMRIYSKNKFMKFKSEELCHDIEQFMNDNLKLPSVLIKLIFEYEDLKNLSDQANFKYNQKLSISNIKQILLA